MVASVVSPYRESRDYARQLVGKSFVGVRRRGQAITGISNPYEPLPSAELMIRTMEESSEDAARRILDFLEMVSVEGCPQQEGMG